MQREFITYSESGLCQDVRSGANSGEEVVTVSEVVSLNGDSPLDTFYVEMGGCWMEMIVTSRLTSISKSRNSYSFFVVKCLNVYNRGTVSFERFNNVEHRLRLCDHWDRKGKLDLCFQLETNVSSKLLSVSALNSMFTQ